MDNVWLPELAETWGIIRVYGYEVGTGFNNLLI
jgi:hypothetical protein